MVTVTGTVVDPDGVTWGNGSWSVSFVPMPANTKYNRYSIGGGSLDPAILQQRGQLSPTGTFSFLVYDSTLITPIGSMWMLTVNPNASAPGCSLLFVAVGDNLNVSAALFNVMVAPRFTASPGSFGYTDGEAQISFSGGSTYYNVVMQRQRNWDGTKWISQGGGGGSGSPVLTIGYSVGDGSVGTQIGPLLAAPVSGSLSRCVVVTKASDSSTDFSFQILKNGSNIFVSPISIVHGTTNSTLNAFAFSSSVTVAKDDIFSLSILTGTSNWKLTIQLEQ